MKNRKTQWHPAFCSAVRLELRADKQKLQYTNEYNLNAKPIQIDLLVIKKPAGAVLQNEIGKIFRGHNILEYKSPEDTFETLRKEGTTSMCEALVELMRPELEAAVKKAREETREEVRAEERANTEREHQRAVAAEEEVQRLREELRRMQNEIQ